MKGRLVTSCESPVSFVRFKPSVPSSVPVLAVTIHWVVGALPTGVTVVIAGAPLSPLFARVKLLLVKPETVSAKVTIQETEAVFVGDEAVRLMEVTAVSGRSTGVIVGSLPPPADGSSVCTYPSSFDSTVP